MNEFFAPNSLTFNGTQLKKDPETGLLYSMRTVGFTLPIKKKFLEIAPKYWPNVTLVCQFCGISKNTYKTHYSYDKVFRDRIDAINDSITDKIEAAMATYALEKGNFMDRIAWLRAHRGEKYNEKKMIQVDVSLTKDKLEAKSASLSQAIDTSIVDAEISESIAAKTPGNP